MIIRKFPTIQELHEFAAHHIVTRIQDKPDLVLGLAAGKTPLPLYRRLIELNRAKKVSFQKVRTFNLDEFWGVGPNSASSFARFTHSNLTSLLDIPQTQVGFFDGAAPDSQSEIERYLGEIRKAGGIDLQILGLGLNGHLGFNEPGSPFDCPARRIELTDSSRAANAYLFPGGNPPKEALTLGLADIMAAREELLLVTDPAKHKIFSDCFEKPPSETFPASVLQNHGNAHILTCLNPQ